MTSHSVRQASASQLERARNAYGWDAWLTSFTALREHGLRGYDRSEIHLAVPAGTPAERVPGSPRVVRHAVEDVMPSGRYRVEHAAPATVRAASSFRSARLACGLLASVVRQTVADPAELRDAATAARRVRHRRTLLIALDDLELGDQALAGIDFVRLSGLYELPPPQLQLIRPHRLGRRRYLDAVWDLPSGRQLLIEVDAALQLAPPRWWQPRLLGLSDTGALTLRFPSAVARHEPHLLMAQLCRALIAPVNGG